MAHVNITAANFEELVLKAEKPVLLDFWATWCGPCRMIAPHVEQIEKERADILVAKVDVDAEMELATRFGITSIPTLVVMKGGQVTATALGYRPKDAILKILE